MSLHQFHLVCFGAGSIIHGVQSILVWNFWNGSSRGNRQEAFQGFALCVLAFLWQFGNLWRELALTFNYTEGAPVFEIGNLTRTLALTSCPVLFSYIVREPQTD